MIAKNQTILEIRQELLECVVIVLQSYQRTNNIEYYNTAERWLEWASELQNEANEPRNACKLFR